VQQNEAAVLRGVPTYGLSEAARYLGVPSGTLRIWLSGRPRRGAGASGRCGALIPAAVSSPTLRLSFRDLAAAWMLRELRRSHGLSAARVRRGLQRAARHFGARQPLAELDLRTDGKELYLLRAGHPHCLSCRGQLTLPAREPPAPASLVRQEAGEVVRIRSRRGATAALGGEGVVIDPAVAFGAPVLASCGVPVSVVAARHLAGETLPTLARQLGCPVAELGQALRWEGVAERPAPSADRGAHPSARSDEDLPLLQSLRERIRSASDVPMLWVDRSCAGVALRKELEPYGLRVELRSEHQPDPLDGDPAWLARVAAHGGPLLVRQRSVRPGDLLCTAAARHSLGVFVLTGRDLDQSSEVGALRRCWRTLLRWHSERPRPFVARVLKGGTLRAWPQFGGFA